MNDLLDLLETRAAALLDEIQALRAENEKLRRDDTEKTGILTEENAALRDALAREKSAREAAAVRIDGLIQRLTERMPG